MSVPILLTVAALGGGYLAMASAEAKRAGQTAAPAVDTSADPVGATPIATGAAGLADAGACGGAAPVGDNPIAGAVGGAAELAPSEVGAVIDPRSSSGGDPATTGSAPVTDAAVAPDSSASTPAVELASERDTLIAAVYGEGQAISQAQESQLLRDFGTLAGAVW